MPIYNTSQFSSKIISENSRFLHHEIFLGEQLVAQVDEEDYRMTARLIMGDGNKIVYRGFYEKRGLEAMPERFELLDKAIVAITRELNIHPHNPIIIPRSFGPESYTTYDDLKEIKIGDQLEVTFGSGYGVERHHKGRTIIYNVNNAGISLWRRQSQRLALIAVGDPTNFILLDDADRYECLMIDLFPINRRPFRGWKNKIVTIK